MWHVACMRKSIGAYQVLVGKVEGRRSLGWKDTIKIDLRGIG